MNGHFSIFVVLADDCLFFLRAALKSRGTVMTAHAQDGYISSVVLWRQQDLRIFSHHQ